MDVTPDTVVLVDTPELAVVLLVGMPVLAAIVCSVLLAVGWRRRSARGDVQSPLRVLSVTCGIFLAVDVFALLRSVATDLAYCSGHYSSAVVALTAGQIGFHLSQFSWIFLVVGLALLGSLLLMRPVKRSAT